MSDATTQNVENDVTAEATEQTAAAEAPVEREREPRRGGRERSALKWCLARGMTHPMSEMKSKI